MLDFDNFEQIDFRVGTVLEVDEFPKARKPAFQLTIDFGHLGILKSSAQITTIYSIPELIGRQCLVLGATQGNDVFLLSPQANLPNGQVVR
jgi:tRNA-binding protein